MGMDVERKGSMGRRTVYPVSSPYTGVPYEPMPPKGRISWLIPLIVVVNVITFIITMAINNCPKNSVDGCIVRFLGRFSFQPFSENPLLGPSSATLQKMGGLKSSLVTDDHQGWRLLTCMWLHGGVFHLLANMLSLVFIGIRLEQEFGFVKVGIVYLLSGFGGSLMSALFIKNQISVGASGALFGLLGAMLSELLTNWSMYNNKCAALTTLIILTVVNLAVGILPHVDNFAHIGGFLTGFLLGFVFLLKPQLGWLRRHEALHEGVEMPVRSKHKAIQYILLITALVMLVAGFLAAIILLFKGIDVNKKCTWCHYLSCVPTSAWRCDDQQITCTTSWDKGYLTMTCSNGKTVDWASVTDVNTSNSRLSAYCTKSCA